MEEFVIQRQISYTSIFQNGSSTLDEVIQNLPSQNAIEWVSYMYLLKSQQTINQPEHELFISLLFKVNSQLQHSIVEYLQKVDISNYVFIDKVALLILLEKLLSIHNDNKRELSKDDFSNLMIAYLMCCDERLSNNTNAIDEFIDAEKFVRLYLPEQLKYNDIYFPKDYRVEFIKFYMFMDFCEKNEIFKPFLKIFLTSNDTKNWDEYLFFVFDLYTNMTLNKDGCGNKIIIEPNSYFGKKYIDAISLNVDKFQSSFDFKCIRENPVYFQGVDTYNVLALNFFLDKMFQSFIFDFAKILVKNKEQSKINNYTSFKGLIGEYFTEHVLFYEIMDRCFKETAKVKIGGRKLKEFLNEGEPDYYLRKGNNIFLFELKDVLLNAKTKHCGDFDLIRSELLELFESSSYNRSSGETRRNAKPKGINQLLNVIENKLEVINNEVDVIDYVGKLNVFPIIVYQDCCFDIEGVNYILNDRFQKLQKSRNIQDKYTVKSLVMLSLTTLIQLEDFFSDSKLDLGQILNGYINECTQSELKKTLPFNKYLMRYAIEKGYNHKKTKWFDTIINNLIEKERSMKIAI